MKKNIKVKGNKISVDITISKNEKYKIFENKGFFSLNIHQKTVWVNGITSMCKDMRHVLFLDYDNICRWIVEAELKSLCEENNLTPFYLFTTKEEEEDGQVIGNYSAICLTKMVPSQIIKVQMMTHCDKAYVTMPRRNIFRSWVLRQAGKGKRPRPKFLKVVKAKKVPVRETSTAHKKWLETVFKVPRIRYYKEDGLTKIFVNHYETANRTK